MKMMRSCDNSINSSYIHITCPHLTGDQPHKTPTKPPSRKEITRPNSRGSDEFIATTRPTFADVCLCVSDFDEHEGGYERCGALNCVQPQWMFLLWDRNPSANRTARQSYCSNHDETRREAVHHSTPPAHWDAWRDFGARALLHNIGLAADVSGSACHLFFLFFFTAHILCPTFNSFFSLEIERENRRYVYAYNIRFDTHRLLKCQTKSRFMCARFILLVLARLTLRRWGTRCCIVLQYHTSGHQAYKRPPQIRNKLSVGVRAHCTRGRVRQQRLLSDHQTRCCRVFVVCPLCTRKRIILGGRRGRLNVSSQPQQWCYTECIKYFPRVCECLRILREGSALVRYVC